MYQQHIKDMLPAGFPDQSRVWIYQSSRPFSDKEQREIDEQLEQFYQQWLAHGAPVKGWAKLIYKQFIVFMADETEVGVSGCSTDTSVRLVKSLERQYSVNLFDRLTITFLKNNKAEMLPYGQVQYAIDKGFITADTLLFNNTITTKKDLLNEWLVPLKDSWLAGRVTIPI